MVRFIYREELKNMSLNHYIGVSLILFALGLVCVLTRKNTVHLLMGLELILNAANLNFVAFSHYVTDSLDAQLMSLFVIVIAVSEVTVAFGIVLNIYRNLKSIHIDQMDIMHE